MLQVHPHGVLPRGTCMKLIAPLIQALNCFKSDGRVPNSNVSPDLTTWSRFDLFPPETDMEDVLERLHGGSFSAS